MILIPSRAKLAGLIASTAFFLVIASFAAAEGFFLERHLSRGSTGVEVFKLQQFLNRDPDTKVSVAGPGSPGRETFFFGPATEAAVKRFQEKYRSEILTPIGLYSSTGFVGSMTRKKLAAVQGLRVAEQKKAAENVAARAKQPIVLSISPNRVRNGEAVTITGENFTPTNNRVFLKDGPAQGSFSGLSSYDGKTITFVYQPPVIKVMTESEIRVLPASIVSQIETPIRSAGGTLADALKSYSEQGITSESELRDFLGANGHQLDEIYNYFFVKVENAQGSGISQTALLWGLPKTVSDLAISDIKPSLLSIFVGQSLVGLLNKILPTTFAQGAGGDSQYGGGFFTTTLICTCNGGFMDFMLDYGGGGGSGLYYFEPGFMPDSGSGFGSGAWLGGYQQSGGTCEVGVTPYCVSITGNTPKNPWGASI